MSYVCVFFHNMLVRMQQYGAFGDDQGDAPSGAAIILQLYDEGVELLWMWREETIGGGDESRYVVKDIKTAHEVKDRPETSYNR